MLAVFVMGLRAEKHANKTMIIVTNIDLEERKGTNLPFKVFDIFPQILGLIRNKAMLYYNVRKPF